MIDFHRIYFYHSHSERMWIAIWSVLSVPRSCTFYCFINTLSLVTASATLERYTSICVSVRVDASLYKHDPRCSVDLDKTLCEEDRARVWGTRAICRLAGRFLAMAFRKMLILASGQYDYPFKRAWYAADYKAVAYWPRSFCSRDKGSLTCVPMPPVVCSARGYR